MRALVLATASASAAAHIWPTSATFTVAGALWIALWLAAGR